MSFMHSKPRLLSTCRRRSGAQSIGSQAFVPVLALRWHLAMAHMWVGVLRLSHKQARLGRWLHNTAMRREVGIGARATYHKRKAEGADPVVEKAIAEARYAARRQRPANDTEPRR